MSHVTEFLRSAQVNIHLLQTLCGIAYKHTGQHARYISSRGCVMPKMIIDESVRV